MQGSQVRYTSTSAANFKPQNKQYSQPNQIHHFYPSHQNHPALQQKRVSFPVSQSLGNSREQSREYARKQMANYKGPSTSIGTSMGTIAGSLANKNTQSMKNVGLNGAGQTGIGLSLLQKHQALEQQHHSQTNSRQHLNVGSNGKLANLNGGVQQPQQNSYNPHSNHLSQQEHAMTVKQMGNQIQVTQPL